MALPALPIPPEELARSLSRALGGRSAGPALTVTEPGLVRTPDEPGFGLRLTVDVDGGAGGAGETWRVTIPVDPIDLEPDVSPSALVTVLRANIEEWWDRKADEPRLASWGHRVE